MDFQSLYTAGRISEVVGAMGLKQDRINRRLGLAWAAEKALGAYRDDTKTREILEAFTAGVNAYVGGLGRKRLPVEYKILDYRPEPWTDLKCVLLLKAMSYTLAASFQDDAMTEMRQAFGEEAVDRLFPVYPPHVPPVIPPEEPLGFTPLPVPTRAGGTKGGGGPDGGRGGRKEPEGPAEVVPRVLRTGPGIGSNSWAVSGQRARNGYPILCNDMHLALSLPAIWYEVQLSAPGVNVRGVAFPAAPWVIAGCNETAAWGYTNAGSDVMDWYRITFKDGTRTEYLHGGEWRKTKVREERIVVRGAATFLDRIVYTDFGPVVRLKEEKEFDSFPVPAEAALRWLAHDLSRELVTLDALNRVRGYADFVEAIKAWDCPAQNIVYADREGTIAIWHNGKFPLRWPGQGRYLLSGSEPADEWRGWIPREHVPHVKNPVRGFVSSANQLPAGPGYPYYLGWDFASFERASRINELLAEARDLIPPDMVRMQADVVDVRARTVLPRLLDICRGLAVTDAEKKSYEELRAWNFEARASLVAPTIFQELWSELNRLTWGDEKPEAMERIPWPASQIMVDLIVNGRGAEYFDDRTTVAQETFEEVAVRAFQAAVAGLEKRLGPWGEAWRWGRVKGSSLGHLSGIPGFGRERLEVDGVGYAINAVGEGWGPSWRMVVELGPSVRAWGNYPGGQSGHPGSKHYEDFVDDWAAGRPYELVFLKSADEPDPRIVGRTVMRGSR
jgi:penicillin amidase